MTSPSTTVAKVFAPVLAGVGLGGFVLPPGLTGTSSEPAYNLFHLGAGAVGAVAARNPRASRAFNIGFGLLDLYQLAASRRGWFPARWFRWTAVDDVLHLVVGAGLVAVGVFGAREPEVTRLDVEVG